MRLPTVAVLYVTTAYLFFAITSSAVVHLTSRYTADSSCHTVLQYVETAYFLNVAQQLRGADENLLLFYFNKSVASLLQVLDDKYSSGNMSEVCLDPMDLFNISISSVTPLTVPNSDIPILEQFAVEFNQFLYGSRSYATNGPTFLPTPHSKMFSSNSSLWSSFSSVVTSTTSYYATIPTDIYNLSLPEELNVTSTQTDVYNDSFFGESFRVMGVGSATFNIRFLRYYNSFQGNLFYIPKENYSDDSLVMRNNELVNQIWSEIAHFIINTSPGVQPKEILLPFIARLPRTIDVFFDPEKEEVETLFTQGTGHAVQVNGFQLLCNVTANVLKMYIAGLPMSTCLTPLQHIAKHLFNAMRVNKVEGKNVTVPNIYAPFYKGYYDTAVENVSVPLEAERVTPERVEKVYEKELLDMIVFTNHGHLNCSMLYENGTLETIDLGPRLFEEHKVDLVKSENFDDELGTTSLRTRLGKYLFNIAFSNKLQKWFSSFLNIQLPWELGGSQPAARQQVTCDEEYIYHDPQTNNSWVTEDQHYCCARICMDIDEINSPGILSVDHCCSLCNAVSCPTHEGTLMAPLLTVMVSQYGWKEDDIGTIVL